MTEHLQPVPTATISRRIWEALDPSRRRGAPWDKTACVGRETHLGLEFVECQVVANFPLFPSGQTVATPGALARLGASDLDPGIAAQQLLHRHFGGDWGILSIEDHHDNDRALVRGDRIFSAYLVYGTQFWVITETDRSATTLLLPEDY